MSGENDRPAGAEEDALRNANDHFFQGFFGIQDASRGFLQPTILPELSECLDWHGAPMELVRGLFVDPRLRFKSSDLLWKVRTRNGDESFICISFDHQSRPDKWMGLRFLLIQALAFQKMLAEDQGKPRNKLPVIYCVVLYQGCLLQRADKEAIFLLMFNYAAQKTRNEDELEELNRAIATLDDPAREAAMNGAQILEARGEARGRAQERAEDARRMLQRDFSPETVADILDVPIALVEKLAKGEEPVIEDWIRAVNPGFASTGD